MTRITPVALPDRSGAWALGIADGRIRTVAATEGPARWLALPPLVEVHAHADRAYLTEHEREQPSTLDDAITRTIELRARETRDSVARRARQLLERAVDHGVTRLRTHVDVDVHVGLDALRGVVDACDGLTIEVEIVAFPGGRTDPCDPAVAALLDEALASGATMLGGVVWLHPDPGASASALTDLAAAHGVGIDLHIDETTDPRRASMPAVLDVIERRRPVHVAFSHACVLASLPTATRDVLIRRLASAGVTVNVQPATNLHLQRAGAGEPDRRGIPPVGAMLAAGVDVRFGSDNVADTFYPYGDADPLEAAFLAAITAHVGHRDRARRRVRRTPRSGGRRPRRPRARPGRLGA
jgi:cytosine/creatinine deaminase